MSFDGRIYRFYYYVVLFSVFDKVKSAILGNAGLWNCFEVMYMISHLLKSAVSIFLIVFSIVVLQEGRSQLSVSGGMVCYSRLWLLGTHKQTLNCVPVTKVKSFDMSIGRRLPKKGLREDLVVTLIDGTEFYREGEGKFYNSRLVEKLEAAARGDGVCIVEHLNECSIFLSLILVIVSLLLSCIIFGKTKQLLLIFYRMKDTIEKVSNRANGSTSLD